MQKKQYLWKFCAILGLAVIAAAVALLYVFVLKPKPPEGVKTVNFSIIVRADEGEDAVDVAKTYEVMTEAGTLGELMEHINEKVGLEMKVQDGMLMELFGYAASWTNNGEYFWFGADTDQTSTFCKATINGTEILSADVGINLLNLADGANFVCALVNNDTFGSDFSTVANFETDKVEQVFDGEKSDGYQNDLKQATTILVTVLAITGIAIVAVTGMIIVEKIKSKRS